MKEFMVKNVVIPVFGSAIVIGLLAAIAIPSFVGKGSMHDHLCYNNLRRIDGAKEQLTLKHGLSNETHVTAEQISQYLKDGFASLQCGEKGQYTINPIAKEPRCSFHGTMSEMDAAWRAKMEAQQAESTVPVKAAPSAPSTVR